MVEDVLEQVVDDWLRRLGYFTRTNVRFGPRLGDPGYSTRDHNQMSDLDVLAVHPPKIAGGDPAGVYAISCKAYQQGFSPGGWLRAVEAGRRYRGRPDAWKHLRELWDPFWAAALRQRVCDLTGVSRYTYVLAVVGAEPGEAESTNVWSDHPQVSANLAGNPAELWTFGRMWTELKLDLSERIEPSHVGRIAQLLKASEELDRRRGPGRPADPPSS